jgi:beta-xylosidase
MFANANIMISMIKENRFGKIYQINTMVSSDRYRGVRAPASIGAIFLGILSLAACQAEPMRAAGGEASPARTAHDGRAEAPRLQNPVLRRNFPDPFLLEAEGRIYAYATNSAGVRVQVSSSDDLQHWSAPNEGLTRLPAWVNQSRPDVWAPEVMRVDSHYVLYFSARSASLKRPDGVGRLCIGTAASKQPDRDFVPHDAPLICDEFEEGVIDVSPFRDAGRLYLYYKNDGNCCERQTWIMARELDATGLATVGEATRLGVTNDQPWEGHVIEAPTMLKHEGAYYLFYSANAYDKADYAVGYARCDGPLGPCKDASTQPLLRTPAQAVDWFGPGHQSVLRLQGRMMIAYHAWNVLPNGQRDSCRAMHIDELEWTAAGEPFVEPHTGPTDEWRCPARGK